METYGIEQTLGFIRIAAEVTDRHFELRYVNTASPIFIEHGEDGAEVLHLLTREFARARLRHLIPQRPRLLPSLIWRYWF